MIEPNDAVRSAGSSSGLRPLYPASIAFLIEERPLLWYEDPEEYDKLLREIFAELVPQGALNCIFIKGAVDYVWELRRMKRMKHTAINWAMPDAAGRVIAPGSDFMSDRVEDIVRRRAAEVAYGSEKPNADGGSDFADHMATKCVTPEMIHYEALSTVADRLHWISRECERLEGRFHRLLTDFEGRRTSLAAMAKSLVDREKAEVIDVKEAN